MQDKFEHIHEYSYNYNESGNIINITGRDNSAAITQTENAIMEYDAENNRTAVETPEYREEYITDNTGTLTQILEAVRYLKDGKKQNTTYVYGDGVISEETKIINIAEEVEKTSYVLHHYDHLGNTTELTDSTGKVVSKYAYGVYGELKKIVEETATAYLYNGKYGVRTDETGLYYMRSRYYNVTIKRFINADTERGNITNGKSLNRYSYVQGNPVSYTDPYGLSPLDNPSAMAHILFGLLGVVPGLVGATADLANAILYFTEGKYTEGVISLIGGIASVFGIPCVDKMIKAGKLGKYAADIARITKLMSNTAGFLINGENTIRQSMDMCHKYFVDKKGVSAETAAELALLAASVLGTYLSAKGIKGAVDEWRIKGGSKTPLAQYGDEFGKMSDFPS